MAAYLEGAMRLPFGAGVPAIVILATVLGQSALPI